MTSSLILHTILALLLLIIPFGALYVLDRPSIRPFATALVRGIVQLLVFSLIVWGVYKINNTWINIIWFIAMTIWGGLIVVNKCHLSIKDYLLPATCQCGLVWRIYNRWIMVTRSSTAHRRNNSQMVYPDHGSSLRSFSSHASTWTEQLCNDVSAKPRPIRFSVRQWRFAMESPDALFAHQSFGNPLTHYRQSLCIGTCHTAIVVLWNADWRIRTY